MTTTFTPLPDPAPDSSSQSREDFEVSANEWAAAQVVFHGELGAAMPTIEAAEGYAQAAGVSASAAVSATGYTASSTTSLAIGTGSKVFTTQASKSFAASGDRVTAMSRGSPTNRMRGSATYSGTTLTITVDETMGSGTFADWILVLSALEPLGPVGRQSFYIPAAAMIARTTNGAAAGAVETTTNKVMIRTLDFDTTTVEFAQFAIRMPKQWNEGTVTFQPSWSHPSTTTNFGVSWSLRAVAIGDNEALDAAFGTAQSSDDTGGTTDRLYIGPESAAITIAGTPQPEDWVVFDISRATAAGADTLAVDARLHGVTVYITTVLGTDS